MGYRGRGGINLGGDGIEMNGDRMREWMGVGGKMRLSGRGDQM